jgi:hypothetical protein
MDWVQLHVAINEAPAVGVGIGTALLMMSAVAGGRRIQKTAFELFAISAVLAIAVFLSGGPAQTALQYAPGMSKDLVEEHWYAAKVALSLSTLLGVIGIAAIRFMRNGRALSRGFMLGCLLACAAAVASNGWAVYSGIRVQISEIKAQYPPETVPDLD